MVVPVYFKYICLLSLMIINPFTKKIEHTSNITNAIARHNHNSYEHNVSKNVNKRITPINNYVTEQMI